MKKIVWVALGIVVVIALLAALLLGAYLVWGLPDELGRVTVNGEVINLRGAHAGHWLLASLIVLVVLMVAIVVIPAVALLALVVPVTLAAFGLATGAVLVGLLLSPLIALGWWLWQRRRRNATISA